MLILTFKFIAERGAETMAAVRAWWRPVKFGMIFCLLLGGSAVCAHECANLLREKFQVRALPGFQLKTLVHAQTNTPLGQVLVGKKLPHQIKRFAATENIAGEFASFLAGKKNHADMVIVGQEIVIKRKQSVVNDQFLIPLPMGLAYVKLKMPWPKLPRADQQVMQSVFGGHLASIMEQRHRSYDIWHDTSFVLIVSTALAVAIGQFEVALDRATVGVVMAIATAGILRGVPAWFRAHHNTHFMATNIFDELAQGHLANAVEDFIIFVPGERQLKALSYDLSLACLSMVDVDPSP